MEPVKLQTGQLKLNIESRNISVGVTLHRGKVSRIESSSILLGQLFTCDIIKNVNGKPVQTTADFLMAFLAKVPGTIVVDYERDEAWTSRVKTLPSPNPNMELNEIDLYWRSGGSRIGFLIHHDFSKRVLISIVEDGTAAASHIKAGDILVKVNGLPVVDRDKARTAINDSINKYKKVSLTVERAKKQKSLILQPSVMVDPTPQAAIPAAATSPVTSAVSHGFTLPPPLAPDVLQILAKNRDFYKQPAGKSIFVMSTLPAGPQVAMGNPDYLPMPCDPSPKPLKPTPKRVGS